MVVATGAYCSFRKNSKILKGFCKIIFFDSIGICSKIVGFFRLITQAKRSVLLRRFLTLRGTFGIFQINPI